MLLSSVKNMCNVKHLPLITLLLDGGELKPFLPVELAEESTKHGECSDPSLGSKDDNLCTSWEGERQVGTQF